MVYAFVNPEFTHHMYYCPCPAEKGFMLSNRLKDALQAKNVIEVQEHIKKLKEQAGGMKVEIVKVK
jgi:hypothetical protein